MKSVSYYSHSDYSDPNMMDYNIRHNNTTVYSNKRRDIRKFHRKWVGKNTKNKYINSIKITNERDSKLHEKIPFC